MKPELKSQYGDVATGEGAILMDALLEIGMPVASSCGGEGVCNKCRMHVREITPGALSTPTQFEKGLLNRIGAEADERISCQTTILGTIEVDADYW